MNPDEPLFDDDSRMKTGAASSTALRDRIQRLANDQPYAVLCLQGDGQPYGALVAIAFAKDLRHVVFATPVTTRKFRLLSECDHVALVVDNRPDKADELMEVEAVTATGRSHLIDRGAEFDEWAEVLMSRHPYLKSLLQAATCALFRVDVVRFFHVVRFQEVQQWIPTDDC